MGLGFHTAPGGADPGELYFRPRGVGVVEIWKNVYIGDGTQSHPGTAGLGGVKRGRGPILPGLRSLYAPQPISDWPVKLGFPTVQGGVDPGEIDFRPRDVGIVEMWKYL